MTTSNYARTLREMCGVYHPEETEINKRFVLPVGEVNVPVFIGGTASAQYPEIRIYPFWDDEHTYMGPSYKRTMGDADDGEFPDVEYVRARTDTTVREIRSHIEIYGKKQLQVMNIRDALFERIERFNRAEPAYVVDHNDWVEDDNVYINAKYDIDLGIFKVIDLETSLLRTPDVINTSGSWDITKDGLIINPLTSIDNIQIGQICNGGYSFYDGDLMPQKGIMSFKIVRSKKEPDEAGPDIPKWVIHTVCKYKDVMTFDVIGNYSKVNVNEK